MLSSFAHHPGWMFGAAAVASWLAHHSRIPFVVLLLGMGALFGIDGLGAWRETQGMEIFASVGVSALLFLVGLELSPTFFREVGSRPVRILVCTMAVLGGFGVWWARGFVGSWTAALLVGLVFTFNSTAVALRSLGERHELGKTHGRLATSLLVLQDVVASLLLVVVTLIQTAQAHPSWVGALGLFAGKILLLGLGSWVFARFALDRLWRGLARQSEVFLFAGFAYPLVVGLLFAISGLSVELGALVAGISLSQSEFRFELLARMKSLRDLFLAPFFLSVGVMWHWRLLSDVWPMALLGWVVVAIVGPMIVYGASRWTGYSRLPALATAFSLAHAGEFSFLFLAVASMTLGLPVALQAALVSVVVLSMISGSLALQYTPNMMAWVKKRWPERYSMHDGRITEPLDAYLFGCHRVGADFLPVLRRMGTSFGVVDIDPQTIERLEAHKVRAFFGDMSNPELLRDLGVQRAKLIVSTVPDQDAQLALLRYLKRYRAKTMVILVAHEVEEALELYRRGATYVILPHFLGGNYASQLVETHGYEDTEPFEVERLRHVEHLKLRGKSGLFLPIRG